MPKMLLLLELKTPKNVKKVRKDTTQQEIEMEQTLHLNKINFEKQTESFNENPKF